MIFSKEIITKGNGVLIHFQYLNTIFFCLKNNFVNNRFCNLFVFDFVNGELHMIRSTTWRLTKFHNCTTCILKR